MKIVDNRSCLFLALLRRRVLGLAGCEGWLTSTAWPRVVVVLFAQLNAWSACLVDPQDSTVAHGSTYRGSHTPTHPWSPSWSTKNGSTGRGAPCVMMCGA